MEERFQEVLDRQKMMWGLGDYNEIAKILMPAAQHVADTCGIAEGMSVLDVGAGTGNLALEAASRGAKVVATDLAPAQIELGQNRMKGSGLDVEWREADAQNLPFEDSSFDVVASVFGMIFAPSADAAVKEMLRVVKPGGLVASTSWAADGYMGKTLRGTMMYLPPPPEGVDTPGEWGDVETATTRFAKHADSVEAQTSSLAWTFDSREDARTFFEENAAPMIVAKMLLDADVYEKMASELETIQDEYNRGTDGRVEIDAEYLMVVARKAN